MNGVGPIPQGNFPRYGGPWMYYPPYYGIASNYPVRGFVAGRWQIAPRASYHLPGDPGRWTIVRGWHIPRQQLWGAMLLQWQRQRQQQQQQRQQQNRGHAPPRPRPQQRNQRPHSLPQDLLSSSPAFQTQRPGSLAVTPVVSSGCTSWVQSVASQVLTIRLGLS